MMKDMIIRATAANGSVRAFAATTRELVETARQKHNTSPVATAALGRLLTAGAMMGSMMKGDKDILTLQIHGDGGLGGVVVTANSKAEVKGYVNNPSYLNGPNSVGKLDVGGAIGRGSLTVVKDLGLKEPYSGTVELVTGEIAEDLTYYFSVSEQTPSCVGLGVLMNKDNTVRCAGGFIIQLLPFASEDTISALEQALGRVHSVTDYFLQGKTLNTYMVETVRGYLLGLMMETGRSALWAQGEADSLTDLTFTNFMIKTCRITDLLLKKQYKQAIASVETSLQLDPRLISVSTRNFMYCGLALSYMAIGRMKKAAEYLDRSLSLAGQDKNYTFLACFRKYFQVLFMMPSLAVRHSVTISEIRALKIRYTRADESHIFADLEEVPELTEELTPREREVAELAAAGLHNSEIAARLSITEHTVKQHLKSAFQKMNIDRRSKLIEMLR